MRLHWRVVSLSFHVSKGEESSSIRWFILWCMMYAQKGNLMFIHGFQGNAWAKPSDFLLRNKTMWDWDFSVKAHRPILLHLCNSSLLPFLILLPSSLFLRHIISHCHLSLSHTHILCVKNSPWIFFLSDWIYLTLRKKRSHAVISFWFLPCRLLISPLCSSHELWWRDEFRSYL